MRATKGKAAVSAINTDKVHFVSPKLVRKVRSQKGGYGVFAARPIKTGELIVVWGGEVVSRKELAAMNPLTRRHAIQVEENLYLVSQVGPEVGDFVNHSCAPNAGLSGQMSLVALRTIRIGEEICYDYAMSDGSDYDEFSCSCGAETCRGIVTGRDWELPELQERYAGCFSPYLQRRQVAQRLAEPCLADKVDLTVVPDLATDPT
ncbi:MAG: hypothetical protein RL011_1366 [Pseudomonadota bacterium]|jgi:hypothetical protein